MVKYLEKKQQQENLWSDANKRQKKEESHYTKKKTPDVGTFVRVNVLVWVTQYTQNQLLVKWYRRNDGVVGLLAVRVVFLVAKGILLLCRLTLFEWKQKMIMDDFQCQLVKCKGFVLLLVQQNHFEQTACMWLDIVTYQRDQPNVGVCVRLIVMILDKRMVAVHSQIVDSHVLFFGSHFIFQRSTERESQNRYSWKRSCNFQYQCGFASPWDT